MIRIDAEIADLIPDYLANRRADVERLRELAAVRDFEGIRRIGHQMKGSGSSYGLDEITLLGQQLQQAARGEDLEPINVAIDELGMYLRHIVIAAE